MRTSERAERLKTLSERVRWLLWRDHQRPMAFAKECGLDAPTASKAIHGRQMSDETARRIGAAKGVTVNWLEGREPLEHGYTHKK